MQGKVNYQRELDRLIADLDEGEIPSLLLHSCCAPCSSYVLEYLSQYFRITVFYYNPNIFPESEYQKRIEEQKRLISQLDVKNKVSFIGADWQSELFYDIARGYESCPEGGERCFRCYRLRLEEAAKLAAEGGFDYFTTTLTISPMKNAEKLNEIGNELGELYKVKHLPSDFKKKGGYQRSIMLSKEYGLYRQDYCGCVYSKAERDRRVNEQADNLK
ncbi:MAG: epoxyqueuosine reductase QueH [Oscillospiraceae bacterium]|nr:epoxyqueuosine reductase QueH [Oscillospiraceae bacterium]